MPPADPLAALPSADDIAPAVVSLALGQILNRPGLGVLLRSSLLDRSDVCAVLKCSAGTLAKLLAAGDWPKPCILIGHGGRWRVGAVARAIDVMAERGVSYIDPAAAEDRAPRPPGRPARPQLVRRPTAAHLAAVNVTPIASDPLRLCCNVCGEEWPVTAVGPTQRLPRAYWACPKGCNRDQT